MKKTILLTLLICMAGLAACQNTAGEVSGEESNPEVSQEVTQETEQEDAGEEAESTSGRAHRGGAMAVEQTPETELNYQSISVTSENLLDGVWDIAVKESSPQLSWEAVEGAEGYVVYMLDVSAGSWMHMRYTTTETSLEPGEDEGYVGPYPPAGSTHEYVIYVVALQDTELELPGTMDQGNYPGMANFLQTLNVTEEIPEGNVIGYGELSGMYTPQ